MKLSAPVVFMEGGVRQGQIGEVNEIDFDEVKELVGASCISYCAQALYYLTVDEAAAPALELVEAIEDALALMTRSNR